MLAEIYRFVNWIRVIPILNREEINFSKNDDLKSSHYPQTDPSHLIAYLRGSVLHIKTFEERPRAPANDRRQGRRYSVTNLCPLLFNYYPVMIEKKTDSRVLS
jgi:hypothetical protein